MGGRKRVLFENIKKRGNVAREKGFSYLLDAENYQVLLESVTIEDESSVKQFTVDKSNNARREKDQHAIYAITNTIEQGTTLKTELIESAFDFSGISKVKLRAALEHYIGELWIETVCARNAKNYTLK